MNVLFHIGTPKTGTSIIQSHLAQNRRALRDRGFFYPVTISSRGHLYRTFESHHLLTYSWADWSPFNEFDTRRFMDWVGDTCGRLGLRTLLLSAENTFWLPQQIVGRAKPEEGEFWARKRAYVERIREGLGDAEARILVYLRRQDRWIESWYNQQVKNGHSFGSDMLAFADHHHVLLDYETQLSVWAEVFGRENVVVRVYEKAQLPDGLFADFCQVAGLGEPGDFPLTRPARYNAQLERDALAFFNIINALPLADGDKYWLRILLRRITRQFESQVVFKEQSLLSPRERIQVLERYQDMNRRIARTYLGRGDGVLFREPWPDPEAPWTPYPGVPTDTAVAFLVQTMLNIAGDAWREHRRQQAKRARNARIRGLLQKHAGPVLDAWYARRDRELWERRAWDHEAP